MDSGEIAVMIVMGIIITFIIGFCGACIGNITVDVRLDQNTADDICRQLTNNSVAVGSDSVAEGIGDGKLICSIPSFDSTQNIIIKTNN